MKKYYLTIDLGASNGRGIVFGYDGQRVEAVYVTRFKNGIITRNGTDYWNFSYLLNNVKNVLRETSAKYSLESFAIDTWGLDFGLLDKNYKLLDDPVSYRDRRTDGVPEKLFQKVQSRELYNMTGIQHLQGNTVFQIYSMLLNDDERLKQAKHLLMMPDLLTYFLTGELYTEYSIASTTQMIDPYTRSWNDKLLQSLSLPRELLHEVIFPGRQSFPLLENVRKELDVGDIKLVTAASHDTASAVIAIPTANEDCLYISSGTWSVLGTEIEQPVICDDGFKGNFTNEGGFDGSIRYCRSLMGLWLIQECVRCWREKGLDVDFAQLDVLAADAKQFAYSFDPQNSGVQGKCDMPAEISALCIASRGSAPRSMGEFARCIYECMAFNYRRTVEMLEAQIHKSFKRIYIVGGGTHAAFLNQCVANATGKTVVAGVAEATAYGNAFAQLYYGGEITSCADFRSLLQGCESLSYYEPSDKQRWDDEYSAFLKNTSR